MRAPGMTGIASREVGCALAAVETKLDGRRAFAGLRRERKSAERNQQALRGDGIRDDDADQRSQEPLGLDVQSEYAAHAKGTIDPAAAALHQLTTEQTLHNAIDATFPPAMAIYA